MSLSSISGSSLKVSTRPSVVIFLTVGLGFGSGLGSSICGLSYSLNNTLKVFLTSGGSCSALTVPRLMSSI